MLNKSASRATIQVSVPEPPNLALLFDIIWGFPFLAIFPVYFLENKSDLPTLS